MKNRFRQKASALVTTLFVVVVLSTIVMAFMASMSLERKIASSMKNKFQAELAAEAGLNAAMSQISLAMSTNQSFLTGIYTNVTSGFGPVITIGVTNLTDTNQLMPLVSTDTTNLSGFGSNMWVGLTNTLSKRESTNTNDSVDVNVSGSIQVTVNTNLYRAPWVVFSTNSSKTTRYAFFVLDESARINPLLTGANSSLTNSTNWYSGASDLILTNTSGQLFTAAQQSAIWNASNATFTQDTIAQSMASRTNYEKIKHLITASRNPTFDTVPAGFTNVTNRAKFNINNLATNTAFGSSSSARATNLANLIYSNIPTIASRDPSLRGTPANELAYLRRLSASIVDYISDSNALPTAVNGSEPAGQKLTPHVTAISIRYRRIAYDTNSASTTIESQPFLQVWNPYTSTINATGIPVRFEMTNRVRLNFGNGIKTPFANYDATITTNLSIRPNEFVVLEFPSTSQSWSAPTTTNTPFISGNKTDTSDDTFWPTFNFYFNTALVNRQRRADHTYPTSAPNPGTGGLNHFALNFSNANNLYHSSFIPANAGGAGWRSVGDPRSSFLSSYDWVTVATTNQYTTNSYWKGRQNNATNIQKSQDFLSMWRNRDFVRLNASVGNLPLSINQTPAQVSSAFNPSDTNNAISVIRNAPMLSVGELGHIFDPAQADDDLTAPSGGSPVNSYLSGGGRTLRIGQPEFQIASTNTNIWNYSWNTNSSNPTDRAAIQLLDLFSVNPTNASGFPTAIGRINPNTAPLEVLAAVLSGIRVSSDTGAPIASLSNPTNLANIIISNRPYNKSSDFRKFVPMFAVGTNYLPSLGTSVGGGTTNLAVMDRMREEAFGKFVQHLSLQSRTYRIVCIGELLDTKGRPISRAQLESLIYCETNSLGNFTPTIQWKKNL